MSTEDAKNRLIDKVHALTIQVCKECHSPDCREFGYGDEGLTICPDCRSVEAGYSEAIEIGELDPVEYAAAKSLGLLEGLVCTGGE